MNVTDIPQTPEKMFAALIVVIAIGFVIGLIYTIYQLVSK